MHRLYANTTPFYKKNLSMHCFWYLQGTCNQSPMDTEGWLYLHSFSSKAANRKGRGTRDQTANIRWIMEKAREFQNNIYFCFIDYTKAFDCVDHNKLENSSRDGNTRPAEKSICRTRSYSLNQTWNNRLVLNWERSTSRLWHLLIQLLCKVHHVKCQVGWSTSWNQDCW